MIKNDEFAKLRKFILFAVIIKCRIFFYTQIWWMILSWNLIGQRLPYNRLTLSVYINECGQCVYVKVMF